MSGIYGLFYRDGRTVTESEMCAMREAIPEWGRDDHGHRIMGNLGMGTLIVHDTPESLFERQPLQCSQTDYFMLCADVRIDNREDLCTSLAVSVKEQTTTPDSALLLKAYVRWGKACLDRIVGAFAFAVWNNRENHLFLARDHIGFRPLYYFSTREKLIFASDVRAIVAIAGVTIPLDPHAISAARFQFTPFLKEHSLYREVYKLLPAASLLVDRKQIHKEIYWHPERYPLLRYSSNDEYARAMLEKVHQAMKSTLRTIHPVGAHLSGGLDSSAVTIIASRMIRERGRHLSGVFSWSPPPRVEDYPMSDERRFVELVCEIEGLSCTYSSLTVDDVLETWMSDIRSMPQDVVYSEVSVRRSAARQGIRTIVSGWGGDEFATFNGRGFYSEQLIRLQWLNLISEMRAQHRLKGSRYTGMFLKHLFWPLLPARLYGRRRGILPNQLLDDPHISKEGLELMKLLSVKLRPRATIRQNHLNFLEQGWLTYRLESWIARGLEQRIDYRFPLLDRRLLEFCFGLPPEQFVQKGWNRFIFRNAMNGTLPDSICWQWDNKTEPATVAARQAVIEKASLRFAEICKNRELDSELISSMWRDKLLRR